MRVRKELTASLATSLSLAALFYFLAMVKNIYSPVDIAGGMFFVFILSLIISASIWPNLIKK
ncbi:MAG: hypothetical protein QXQ02_04540 [Halobacteria archaeon]